MQNQVVSANILGNFVGGEDLGALPQAPQGEPVPLDPLIIYFIILSLRDKIIKWKFKGFQGNWFPWRGFGAEPQVFAVWQQRRIFA
jgi:hypothetical protein